VKGKGIRDGKGRNQTKENGGEVAHGKQAVSHSLGGKNGERGLYKRTGVRGTRNTHPGEGSLLVFQHHALCNTFTVWLEWLGTQHSSWEKNRRHACKGRRC